MTLLASLNPKKKMTLLTNQQHEIFLMDLDILHKIKKSYEIRSEEKFIKGSYRFPGFEIRPPALRPCPKDPW